MSSTSLASLVTIGCTPQTSASRRAVSRFGVRASTVAFGPLAGEAEGGGAREGPGA